MHVLCMKIMFACKCHACQDRVSKGLIIIFIISIIKTLYKSMTYSSFNSDTPVSLLLYY